MGSRYGLRPARLPTRNQHCTKEINEPGQELHLSTADHLNVGFHPWLNIGSARWLRFGSAPTLAGMLTSEPFDVVLIGAGVRKDEEHFLVFERLVNVVHEHAPHARMAFNTGPTDSAAAIQRWA